jgi:hypothetical protein
MSMDDYQFAELQRELQATMEYLERLQQRYIKETGRRFVGCGMEPPKKRCPICFADYHGSICPICHGEWKEAANG